MPLKIRTLKAMLRQCGYIGRAGKGDHTIWTHPAWPGRPLVLAGTDGEDARPYQEAHVRKKIERVHPVSGRSSPPTA